MNVSIQTSRVPNLRYNFIVAEVGNIHLPAVLFCFVVFYKYLVDPEKPIKRA
jgi:hypothetical protein